MAPRFKTYSIATRELAALAFAAQRVNGTLHKDPSYFDVEKDAVVEVTPNKVLMRDSFAIEPGVAPRLVVTDEDRTKAEAAVSAIQQDVMLKQLSGARVNDFIHSMVTLFEQETCTARDCGMMAFLPRTYESLVKVEAVKETVRDFSAASRFLGTSVGTKILIDFEMISNRYLQQFNCYSVFGHDGKGNLVQFLTAHQHLVQSGSISGKIKRLENSRYHNGAEVTELNFVKKAGSMIFVKVV